MQKKCSKCGKTKDIIEFQKRNSNKDKLSFQCKSCIKISDKLRKEKNIKFRAEKNYVGIVKKRCSKCGKVLSIDFFTVNRTNKDGFDNGCKL